MRRGEGQMGLVLALSLGAFAATAVEPPPASVTELSELTVEVEDEGSVRLATASCFNAWNGAKPSYPPSEDEELANLRAYLTQAGDIARLEYFDWIVDYVISFDREVPRGGVKLYGQTAAFGEKWYAMDLPTIAANTPYRLLNMDIITYGMALEMVDRFQCGARSRQFGTTITVELRLFNPQDSADSVVLARCSHTFRQETSGNWFDACVREYLRWPSDAEMAVGGGWRADAALDEVASVKRTGELSVATESSLRFAASEPKSPGRKEEAVVETTLALGVRLPEDMPEIGSCGRAGVVAVLEGDGASYYGIVRLGATNGWVRLDGPAVDLRAELVTVKMSFRKVGSESTVRYTIAGSNYSYSGRTEIPIQDEGSIAEVAYGGEGAVCSLFASLEKIRQGIVFSLR